LSSRRCELASRLCKLDEQLFLLAMDPGELALRLFQETKARFLKASPLLMSAMAKASARVRRRPSPQCLALSSLLGGYP